MKAGIKKHIRQLLWDYQHIEKKITRVRGCYVNES